MVLHIYSKSQNKLITNIFFRKQIHVIGESTAVNIKQRTNLIQKLKLINRYLNFLFKSTNFLHINSYTLNIKKKKWKGQKWHKFFISFFFFRFFPVRTWALFSRQPLKKTITIRAKQALYIRPTWEWSGLWKSSYIFTPR